MASDCLDPDALRGKRDKTASTMILMAIGLSFVGCSNKAAPEPRPAVNEAAKPTILVAAPQKEVIRRVIEQPGTVQSDEETQLFAKMPGFVRRVMADIGQPVKGPKFDASGREIEPGQLLAEISTPETNEEAKQKQALVKQAEAEIEQTRKALVAAGASVASAESQVEESRAGLAKAQALYDRWKSEESRVSGLVADGVIDSQTRDETLNQFKAADAARQEAKARVNSSESSVRKAQADRGKVEADIKAAEAKVEVCKADARRLEALLSYNMIRAPFDGVVTSRRVNTGDLLRGESNRQGIFSVARLDPVRVVVFVPEADAGLVREKLPADLNISGLDGKTRNATVNRTSWALEPGSRTLRTEIDLPNKDAQLRPGMYVNTRIKVELPAQWTVPASAIVKQGDGAYCFLVLDGKAVRAPVQVGRSDAQRTEVMKLKRDSQSDQWNDFSDRDRLAFPAASIVAGQDILTEGTSK